MTTSSLGSRGRIVASFLGGVVTTLALVTIVMFVTQRNTMSPPTSAPTLTAPTSAATTPNLDVDSSTGEGEHDHDMTDEDRASWEPVVVGFARNFPTTSEKPGLNVNRWRAALAPYVTPAVADQLAQVDLTKVPRGQYVSHEVLTPGSYQIAVKVNYREAWALVLYVTSDGRSWRVSAYDRFTD